MLPHLDRRKRPETSEFVTTAKEFRCTFNKQVFTNPRRAVTLLKQRENLIDKKNCTPPSTISNNRNKNDKNNNHEQNSTAGVSPAAPSY